MTENIIFYGPPGTGKTYTLQSLMSKYVDYEITDVQLKSAFTRHSEGWILLSLILLQHHGKMTAADVQTKVDSLLLGTPISAPTILNEHSIEPAPVSSSIRSQPRVFFKCDPTNWYVDWVRIQSAMPDFFTTFLAGSAVEKRYDFVTFHQSYSYEDFVEGIRPEYNAVAKGIDYTPKPGVFKLLCDKARKNKEKEYAIFIDEINRGNISEIFGELITLIELDKREGKSGALQVVLPYSKTPFQVPANVSVYGTMNTADRSIDQMDIALRRRFKFVPMKPNSEVIQKELDLNGIDATNIEGVDLIKMFNTMNNRIELLLDSQHLLGHAIFLKVKTAKDIADVIRNVVVPLLEEYFFDDLQKIQLVFNDLDDSGNLKSTAIYCSYSLEADDYFKYTADYMIDDKKHYHVSENIDVDSLKQIYS